MRTRVKVTDLNLRQWEYLQTNVLVTGREFADVLPRGCVVFEMVPGMAELHVEMDLVELAGLMVTLNGLKDEVAVADLGAHYDDRHGDGS